MAAYTSKATGNWSTAGQTTWNEVGFPHQGDTATIQNTHNVTVDVDSAVGNKTDTALVINAGGTLTIAAAVTLSVYGGIDNAGALVLGDGSIINYVVTRGWILGRLR